MQSVDRRLLQRELTVYRRGRATYIHTYLCIYLCYSFVFCVWNGQDIDDDHDEGCKFWYFGSLMLQESVWKCGKPLLLLKHSQHTHIYTRLRLANGKREEEESETKEKLDQRFCGGSVRWKWHPGSESIVFYSPSPK